MASTDLLRYLFYACVGVILYTYVGYPVILLAVSRLLGRPVRRGPCAASSVSVVLVAFNEEKAIRRRVEELAELVREAGVSGEIIVVSDGSSDATSPIARSIDHDMVRVIDLPKNVGKAAALTVGCQAARNEIIVLADSRQSWRSDCVRLLLENFADPEIGAATGELIIKSSDGVMGGVGLYWKFEKWLRRTESRLSSVVGVTGAVAAMRRELFRPIPAGTLLDDVYWPMRVAMQGYRVVHDGRAEAYDQFPARVHDEFRRKVRTLSGNFQLLVRLPGLLMPWRNPLWWQYLSHKVCRLMAPWALLGIFLTSAFLPGPEYGTVLWAQVGAYALGLFGMTRLGAQVKPVSVAGSFIVLNAAAWMAFWVWSFGRASRSWGKVSYGGAEGALPLPQ